MYFEKQTARVPQDFNTDDGKIVDKKGGMWKQKEMQVIISAAHTSE